MAAGGHGCISVTANIAPRLCREMHDAWANGKVAKAIAVQDRMTPLHDALFSETSPGPVKFAASLLGKTTERCRLPLAPPTSATRERVRAAMTEVGLLN
jgi:4-hydroxy-tetrahydrodipicolinate synthase